jgi:hypothetical protein
MIQLDERELKKQVKSQDRASYHCVLCRNIQNGYSAFFAPCARLAVSVCTTFGLHQLKNRWTDFDNNGYRYCATGGYTEVVLFWYPNVNQPITVAERSKARSLAVIVDSNPTRGMDVCACVYSVFVLACV